MTNNNSTTARKLRDFDTCELIGTATAEQIEASDASNYSGVILIDADGDVVADGTWAAQQPGVRQAYVA